MNWTGLAASTWDLFGSDEPQGDHEFYKKLVRTNGGPALDVGCGTGRHLVRFLEAGLDVDGTDTSAEMLAIAREKAERIGLSPNLFRQSMQELDLPRRYRTIFSANGPFPLVVDRLDALEALRRLRTHLEPDGLLAFDVYDPWHDMAREIGRWKLISKATRPSDGAECRMYWLVEARDLVEQTVDYRRRYVVFKDGRPIEEEWRTTSERWYFKHELVLLMEKAGFHDIEVKGDFLDEEFTSLHSTMVFIARP
jgi:SAM-dependent methyltransferase